MIIQGNCLDKLKELPDNSVDAVVTDPPYGLSFMGKKWDYDVPSQEIWEECLRVLKPGGYLLAFAGTRTQHRMAVRIEDAGFEIRDMIAWVYGSGFPKSLNIGKAVDKLQGNEREVVGKRTDGRYAHSFQEINNQMGQLNPKKSNVDKIGQITKPGSEDSARWEGWGTALKPALEPITVARKPLSEKSVAENVLKWGTGGINIDESRVGTDGGTTKGTFPNEVSKGIYGNGLNGACEIKDIGMGRFPANLIHDNSEEVRECFPETGKGNGRGAYNYAGREYDNKDTSMFNGDKPQAPSNFNDSGNASRFFKSIPIEEQDEIQEECTSMEEKLEKLGFLPEAAKSIIYQAKASKSERNKGCDNTAIVLIEWSIWNEKHTTQEVKKAELLVDTGILQPKDTEESGIQPSDASGWNTLLFGKSLTAKYQKDIKSTILTETNSTTTSQIYNWLALLLTKEYIADVSLEITNGGSPAESVEPSRVLATTMSEVLVSRLGVKNAVLGTQLKISVKEGRSGHPTVKPVALMEYLVKLVSREGAVVLDPFMGSGSTGIACKKLGREFIGIEIDGEYINIAQKRIENQVYTPKLL